MMEAFFVPHFVAGALVNFRECALVSVNSSLSDYSF